MNVREYRFIEDWRWQQGVFSSTYAYSYIYIYIYICMYVCICMYVYVCMYIYIDICIGMSVASLTGYCFPNDIT